MTARRDEAEGWALALASQGVSSTVLAFRGGWVVVVAQGDAAKAARVLRTQASESPQPARHEPPTRERRVPFAAAAAAGGALMAAHVATRLRGFEHAMRSGEADAAAMLDGQPWRALTALTLHADLGHAASNAFFLAVFMGALMWETGVGVGLLLVLAAGGLGNMANALLRGPGHAGIGASTAVFGAVGRLAGRAARIGGRRALRRGKVWAPLVAGVALLALFGAGKGTDALAHVAGFAAGAGLGAAVPLAALPSARAQRAALGTALAALGGAWLLAL
jgi:membrane associated rhomboid family serine protease